MKILIVSNLYPPHHHGGYELRCGQVAEYLQRQGHDVRVVASDFQITDGTHTASAREETINGVRVSRFLRHYRLDPAQSDSRSYWIDVVRRQIADAKGFARLLDEYRPDVVSWWNLEGISKVILQMVHERGIPSTHCIDDNWMIREFGADGGADVPFWLAFWRLKWGPQPLRPLVRAWLARWERRVQQDGIWTTPFRIPPSHVLFISEFWRYMHAQAGLDVSSSEVIYGGVSPERFYIKRTPADYASGPLRLLYAGYVDVRRGLLTIIEALGLLPSAQRERVHLSVASGGPVVPDEYVDTITRRISELKLSKQVTFLGRVPHDQMPGVYQSHDVLVFASTRNEGMPMVMMEAMCAGCAVPNTGSGGSIELSEKANTPIFPKEHPFALSRLLSAMEKDRMWVADIALRGQQTVLREFTIERMLEKTADALTRTAGRKNVDEAVAGSR